MCHEISHYKPTDVAVTASADVHTYQGISGLSPEPAPIATLLAIDLLLALKEIRPARFIRYVFHRRRKPRPPSPNRSPSELPLASNTQFLC
jgi:hypothetical protein